MCYSQEINKLLFIFSNSECSIAKERGIQGGLEHYIIGISADYSGTNPVTGDIVHYVTILIWRNCSVYEHLPHGD